jgi:hypothetical protein
LDRISAAEKQLSSQKRKTATIKYRAARQTIKLPRLYSSTVFVCQSGVPHLGQTLGLGVPSGTSCRHIKRHLIHL